MPPPPPGSISSVVLQVSRLVVYPAAGLERFKQLIREDYYMAEALWAGLFCSLCVSFAMQLTKAYIVATSAPVPTHFPM